MTAYNQIIVGPHKTPAGELLLGSYRDMLCLCDWKFRTRREEIDERISSSLSASFKDGTSEVISNAEQQLNEYFSNGRTTFDLPLLMVGSEFQKQVWTHLQKIPYGETCSYKELSRKMGNEKAIRAVAAANGANAISIIIPCHRIIGSKGELTGYAGGISAKQKLLKLESAGREGYQHELF